MKWVRIAERVHAVLREHGGKTLCGIPLEQAHGIVSGPGFNDRCGNCDQKWRAFGRAARRPKPVNYRALYTPRFKYEDWEAQA